MRAVDFLLGEAVGDAFHESLCAMIARAPKPGEVVIKEERYHTLVTSLRAHHRELYPHSMRSRLTVDELLRDIDFATMCDEIEAGGAAP